MIGVKVDQIWTVPFMRRPPFIALHIEHFGHYHYAGEQGSHRVYKIGLIWGRQFMPKLPRWAGMRWWKVIVPWRERG